MEDSNKTRNSFVVLILTLLVIGLSAVVPVKWLGVKGGSNSYTPVDFTKLKNTKGFTKDTNGDGVLTWNELVLSSAGASSTPLTTKGAEVDPEITKALNDPNNLTASFSKNLYVTSAYLANNNITDAETQQKAMSGITSEEIAKTASKKYLYSDLTIAKSETKETIKAYGNELAGIINSSITKKNIDQDLPGVVSFLNSKEANDLVPIQKDAKKIGGIVQKLIVVKVPPSATLYHLMVVNQMVTYRDTLINLSSAATDPVRAAIVIQKYPETMLSTLLLYKKLSEYFDLKNITFSPQETGYVFTVGYTLE